MIANVTCLCKFVVSRATIQRSNTCRVMLKITRIKVYVYVQHARVSTDLEQESLVALRCLHFTVLIDIYITLNESRLNKLIASISFYSNFSNCFTRWGTSSSFRVFLFFFFFPFKVYILATMLRKSQIHVKLMDNIRPRI